MISEYLKHLTGDPVLFCCSIAMGLLFGIDLFGLLAHKFKFAKVQHRSFSASIVSIGLLTTFIGILQGLYGFDTTDISKSVPQLLEGLRFAFAGSVMGMFLSLILSIVNKFLIDATSDDEILHTINANIVALTSSLKDPGELTKQFTEMKGFLEEHLTTINASLDKALTELARGATEEVIAALERVITEFNDNLTEQFGENFKELNAACLQLVEWQKGYQTHINSAEEQLKLIIESLDQSTKAARQLTVSNAKTQEVCEEVAELIQTYHVQIQTLEVHLKSCRELGDQAASFLTSTQKALDSSTANITQFSGVIESSLSRQSESLTRLTEDIELELPKALGQLEDVLTSLTNQFADDYRSLFQYITKQ